MTLEPNDAAHALHDIEAVSRHSAAALYYQRAAPHLILWGVIWVLGYGATYLWPAAWWAWPVLAVAGMGASAWMGSRSGSRGCPGRASRAGWKSGATFAVLFLFFSALFQIFPPQSFGQVDALFPLLVALAYLGIGIWAEKARFAVLGLVVGLVTVGGYVWMPGHLLLWMAGAGGGALILGGLWMRRL